MISIIVPCYNEWDTLDELYARITASCKILGRDYEVVVVDDGSETKTWKKLQEIHEKDNHWKIVRFSRNFGHQAAVSAGLRYTKGDAVIILDGDLQDPPELIQNFIEKWKEGYQVVYAIRKNRKENVFKRAAYSLFYNIISRISHPPIPRESGDFGLMDRQVVDLINSMPERNRFVRGLRSWTGFRQTGVFYDRDPRITGTPKYTLFKLILLAFNGIFSFSYVPLRITTFLGLTISVIAFLGALFTLIQRIFSDWFATIGLEPVPGFATIVISILFLGGVQLLSIGVLGEYIGRIYDEVKQRPHWIVREVLGISPEESFEPLKNTRI